MTRTQSTWPLLTHIGGVCWQDLLRKQSQEVEEALEEDLQMLKHLEEEEEFRHQLQSERKDKVRQPCYP